MREGYSSQYGTPTVQIEAGDNFGDVLDYAREIGAEYSEGDETPLLVVEFPGRPAEVYSESALCSSMRDI